jgi:hypothetical protein
MWLLAAAFFLGVAALDTFPLVSHFTSAMPYYAYPEQGDEVTYGTFGDYLQMFYYLWLFKDSLVGQTPLFSNPYEFSVGPGYYTQFNTVFFPLSLAYALFAFLFGDVGGYNGLVLASYVASGLVGFALVRLYTPNIPAAVLGGLILALVPYRTGQVLGGHPNGFAAFLLPLTFYGLERAFRTVQSWPAVVAAISIASSAVIEPHIIYYTFLLMGLYLPFRWIVSGGIEGGGDSTIEALRTSGLRKPAVFVIGGSLSVGFSLVANRILEGTMPWRSGYEVGLFVLLPAMLASAWLAYSLFLHRITGEPLTEILRLDARSYIPLWAVAAYCLKLIHPVPYLGKTLLAVSFGGMLLLKGMVVWNYRARIGFLFWRPEHKEIARRILIPLGVGVLIAVGWNLAMKSLYLDASIASGGRPLTQVEGFSPQVSDFFVRHNLREADKNIYMGVVSLFLAGSILFRALLSPRPGSLTERFRLWILLLGTILLFSIVLAFGPHITPYLPLYQFLYDHFPFFNYPRVAGRIVLAGHWAMAILAALALAEGLAPRPSWKKSVAGFAVIGLVAADYWPPGPRGISVVPADSRIYETATRDLGEGRIVEVPLWPGDSAWTSLYQYYVTRYRYRMVNGYDPGVSKRYVMEIFWPLIGVNYGMLNDDASELLRRLNVKYLVFHEENFPEKVSPYPHYLTRKNLDRSPYLEPVMYDGRLRLYRLRDVPRTSPLSVSSPVGVWYEAENLPRRVGKIASDPDASGGRVVFSGAEEGRGYITYGPYTVVPPGSYSAIFRMRTSNITTDGSVVELDVVEDLARRTLARREVTASDLAGSSGYQDVRLSFQVDQPRELEFRVLGMGMAEIWMDYIYVLREGQEDPPGRVEAEAAFFRPFRVTEDRSASGGEAIRIEPNEIEKTLPFELRRRLPAGRYNVRVGYRIEEKSSGSRVAFRIESLAGRSLGEVVLDEQGRMPGLSYRETTFEAVLDRGTAVRFVLDYRRSPGIRVDWFGFEALKR